MVDGREELAPDVGDPRIGILPDQSPRARGKKEEQKKRQDGRIPAKRFFPWGKIVHVDPVSVSVPEITASGSNSIIIQEGEGHP